MGAELPPSLQTQCPHPLILCPPLPAPPCPVYTELPMLPAACVSRPCRAQPASSGCSLTGQEAPLPTGGGGAGVTEDGSILRGAGLGGLRGLVQKEGGWGHRRCRGAGAEAGWDRASRVRRGLGYGVEGPGQREQLQDQAGGRSCCRVAAGAEGVHRVLRQDIIGGRVPRAGGQDSAGAGAETLLGGNQWGADPKRQEMVRRRDPGNGKSLGRKARWAPPVPGGGPFWLACLAAPVAPAAWWQGCETCRVGGSRWNPAACPALATFGVCVQTGANCVQPALSSGRCRLRGRLLGLAPAPSRP
ncbi:uncharacterized protein LOC127032755 [Gopherus flavomarginatus]|uniref:uncharacterized protein LOC127032755 n=1 Tax=Gopherus flavomarginatus TaxID=286002 RepID=UPI0021CC10BD|nr:uncharacterized protein LOC127032755 [Gopherus flavomarginatus]